MTIFFTYIVELVLFFMLFLFAGFYQKNSLSHKQFLKKHINKIHLNKISTQQLHTMLPRHRQSAISLLLLLLLPITSPIQADNIPYIGVLYPESGKRASQLYSTIIKNMRQHNEVHIQTREFAANDSAEDIQQWLNNRKSQAVILLGKKGMNLGKKLTIDIPVISGAHMEVQENHSSVSLTADPGQLFYQLKTLQPDIETVHVIYNNANSGWLIKQAILAANSNEIKLDAIQIDNMRDAGPRLKQLVQKLDPQKDAIWLAYDPILPIKPLLPDLLRKAWDKNLIIFSGNPYHVQRGTLFALFPDYSKLGLQLIELTLNKLDKNKQTFYEPSRYLNSAINIRTASHLGIQISSIQRNKFKMVFPKD